MPETAAHAFIVKVWLEGEALESWRTAWRGHITHVPSGQRRYLHRLEDIPEFIALYLRGMRAER